jgi:phosphotransferase system enzyme I (PtsP)
MLHILQRIVQEVSTALGVEEVVGIIVRRVRGTMNGDVCSLYLVDPQEEQSVLMASDGPPGTLERIQRNELKRLVEMVRERRQPVILSNPAQPQRYRDSPDTGEDRQWTFLGIPIIHYRQVLGALTVQRNEKRPFREDEIAFLVTIAAQLAGAIHHAVGDGSIHRILNGQQPPAPWLQGIPGAPGIAFGTVTVIYRPAQLETVPNREAADLALEEGAFRTAVAKFQEQLRASSTRMAAHLPEEERTLFEAYLMLAASDSLVTGTVQRIRAGNWAPGALRETIAEHAQVFEQMEDAYLRARADDIRDIGRQILMHLQADKIGPEQYPRRCILMGEDLSVPEIAEVPPEQLAGIVCLEGSGMSHTAILARALGIPTVMGLGTLSIGRLHGKEIIVDGYQGRVYLQPPPSIREEYLRLVREEQALHADLETLRDLPAQTPDGFRISLHVNGGFLSDMPKARSSGAEGVGLYRTEFAFMVRNSFPGEEELYHTYRRTLLYFSPRPVTMRTLDIGGDKALPYFSWKEDNPSLGWRGIRVMLDHPEIFLTQLRAMLRANAGLHNLRIVLPMVISPAEVDEAVGLLDQAHNELLASGKPSARPSVGVLCETPAAAYQVAALLRRAEFLSIGTNDLTQYLLAVDRNNPRVAHLYDSLHPAVIRVVHEISQEVHKWGKTVSVCGEMAGDPLASLLLQGMAIDTLSMAAPDLPRIKRIIRTFTHQEARHLLMESLARESPQEVHEILSTALEQAGLGSLVRRKTGAQETRPGYLAVR